MAPDAKTILQNSVFYRMLTRIQTAGEESLLLGFLTHPKVLLGGAILVLTASIVRILLSGLHVTVKFLSFALLAIVLLVLVWPYTKPLTSS